MRDYKVIDTFIFGGELDILKMRLDYLYDSVDYFVFSESNKTHFGQKKELVFLQNYQMFEEYKDKIRYVVFEPDITNLKLVVNPDNIFDSDIWKLERGQRSQVHNKVKELSDENTMILHSDLDEFPDKSKFDIMREMTKDLYMEVVSLEQPTYYYSPLNLLEMTWYGTVVFNHQTMMNLSDYFSVRENRFHSRHMEKAGWHFSFFAPPEKISHKIQTYAHQEYNIPEITNVDVIKSKIYNGQDVLNRPDVIIKKLDQISDEFPIEFYRYELFFQNTFDRGYLKPQQVLRRNSSMQIALEIENLQLTVANHNPKVVVEIGTANGGTLARWLEIPSVETIISIDYPMGIHGGQGFEERTYVISDALEQANLVKKEFYAVNGDSRHPYLINRVEELLNGRKIDFLFIDGDHTYEGVKGDFNCYEKFLSETAIVGFHDIINSKFHQDANCYVSRFWDEMKKQYEHKEFIYTQHLDLKLLPYLGQTKQLGGFGGIGVFDYSKKKQFHENISLIVPIYNNVDNTINNVNTTLSSSKYINDIVLYSNGTDYHETVKLLDFVKKDKRIRLHVHENPIGFIKAVNNAIKMAKNNLVLCMNSDASMFGNWEERLLPFCVNENYGLVGPVMTRDFILGCCFIFKKSVINKIGMLDEGFGLGYEEDVEYSSRVKNSGYLLGYCEHKSDLGWTKEVNFPIYHRQGETFEKLDVNLTSKLVEFNSKKREEYNSSEHVIVMKDMDYDEIIEVLNTNMGVPYIVINRSGENFEKIRYDERIVKECRIFECTNQMNMDSIIDNLTKNKKVTLLGDIKKKTLTWLAKFDDHASMGILSQRVLEKLKNIDFSCKKIIGETQTNNPLILNALKKDIKPNLGIMFSYPDMYQELNDFRTKVIYTGVDTTGGIPNFAQNANKVDHILTPSNLSKERMIKLGVTKPIHVFPHGIDPNIFKFKERTVEGNFKFLYIGECSDRKGIFQLLDAFTTTFNGIKDVELHIKSNTDMLFYNGNDIVKIKEQYPNIHWHVGNEGHDKVIELYNECHAYVYPSRADTFGMTLLEAMACGLPIISTREPGATELIEDKFYEINSTLVPVKDHPWMLGKWGEPNVVDLKFYMAKLYSDYKEYAPQDKLKEYSDYIRTNYSWEKVTERFQTDILPQLTKKVKILTLVTSYNRPHHIVNVMKSLKEIRENDVINDVYIVENSNGENKDEIVKIIKENMDEHFRLYVSDINMGQRGALLQMLEDVNIDDYDYIQFTDQDNIFNEPLSTYCEILDENRDIFYVTGYMSKEHGELGWRKTRHGNLCEKRSLRAGHMFAKVNDFKTLFPIHLDGEYGQPYNSSWYAGLDWEVTYWNKKSPGKLTQNNFVLCVPGGVLHKGVDSTFYEWNVEENEYPLEELIKLRSQ